MVRAFTMALAIIACCSLAIAQSSGNVSYSQSGGSSSGSASARQNERNKRAPIQGEVQTDGMFLEANVLMNVLADEYVAVFGVSQECVTVAECSQKIDAVITEFSKAVQQMGISSNDVTVDFATQSKIYEYKLSVDVAKEELTGFEVKKNVSIHYKDKQLLDKLVVAASRSKIFDLIKVDYMVKDQSAAENKVMEEATKIIKQKASRYEQLLGVKLQPPIQIIAERPSIYFPTEMYDSYTAQETQSMSNVFDRERARCAIQGARKSRTFFFNPLTGDGFDRVINPIVMEPVVQFTLYLKVKYGVEGAKAAKQ